jgi:hypothetical protein
MKRKESRCNPINIQITRILPKANSLCGVQKLQPFFPPIENLFKTENLDKVSEYGIKFPDTLSFNSDSVTTLNGDVKIHPKITMLLNPYKWMKGINLELPSSSKDSTLIHKKLQSSNNAAYVGSLFNAVLSLTKCQHFPKVFGVFSGISEEFKLDISDDYDELCERPWFSKNVGKTFTLKLEESLTEEIKYTRTSRPLLNLGEETDIEYEELEPSKFDLEDVELQKVFEEEEIIDTDSESTNSTTDIFDLDSESEYSLDDDGDDISFAWAHFKNVPVQLTIMEKLDGTFYELITQNPDPIKWYAWTFQIVFALAFMQRNFGLIHNDLHGNNVMYVPTTKEYFYYSCSGITYKVPTYGYLLKIIDFDRGIGYIKLHGMKESKLFMSDQFDISDEAGGQYNFQPFFKDSVPIIKPNFSFDLVRFATSMFWDLYPEGPESLDYKDDKLFKLLMKWLTLEDGTSILFHKQNPKLDRYYGFNLYKAIARFCKDSIPKKELSEFTEFQDKIPPGELPLVLDN